MALIKKKQAIIPALFALAAGMTPRSVLDGIMKKRGFKPYPTSADLERIEAAKAKRERRAAKVRSDVAAGGYGPNPYVVKA